MDDLFLPWNVDAAIVLHPDTLVQGDVGSLWNSSEVTKRSWKRQIKMERERAVGRDDQQPAAFVVGSGAMTKVQDPSGGSRMGGSEISETVVAVVDDCGTPQSKVSRPA